MHVRGLSVDLCEKEVDSLLVSLLLQGTFVFTRGRFLDFDVLEMTLE